MLHITLHYITLHYITLHYITLQLLTEITFPHSGSVSKIVHEKNINNNIQVLERQYTNNTKTENTQNEKRNIHKKPKHKKKKRKKYQTINWNKHQKKTNN
jgi:hypothetical protein